MAEFKLVYQGLDSWHDLVVDQLDHCRRTLPMQISGFHTLIYASITVKPKNRRIGLDLLVHNINCKICSRTHCPWERVHIHGKYQRHIGCTAGTCVDEGLLKWQGRLTSCQ